MTLSDLKIFNAFTIGEDDGVDVCESSNVTADHVMAISLDDPFSTKTWDAGTDLTGHWTGSPRPLDHVLFQNCLAWTDCFAFKLGAGFRQPQSDVTFRDCVAFDCAHAIGVSHSYGSGELSNATFENIDVEHVGNKCLGQSWGLFFIEHEGAVVRNVVVKNVTVRDFGSMPFAIKGLSAALGFEGVTFQNVRLPDGKIAASAVDLHVESSFATGVKVVP